MKETEGHEEPKTTETIRSEVSETEKLALTQNEIVHVTTKVNFIN